MLVSLPQLPESAPQHLWPCVTELQEMQVPSICPVQHWDEGLSWGKFSAGHDSDILHVGECGLTEPVGFAGKKK